MNLTLVRDPGQPPNCTLGKLTVGEHIFDSMERSWVPVDGSPGGMPLVSCVPVGVYKLALHHSPEHPMTFALVNEALDIYANPTPGKRSDILIHAANWAWELMGCIAPGLTRKLNGQTWMVTDSKEAMTQLQMTVPRIAGHTLEIT
jgi:Family of unknown function (DUF5675)